ncbi:MAG TPA: endolytic transglycosylase MltG [Firmicutes bacterium]|nr:endolytic transglycosylase MltG [Bacillota bacterium]
MQPVPGSRLPGLDRAILERDVRFRVPVSLWVLLGVFLFFLGLSFVLCLSPVDGTLSQAVRPSAGGTLNQAGPTAVSPGGAGLSRRGETIVAIPGGASLKDIALLLESRGIIKSAPAFIAYARLTRQDKRLEAGHYRLSANMSVPGIVRMLREGRVATMRFTIPEGFTAREIAGLLSSKGLADQGRFREMVTTLSPGDLLDPGSPSEARLLQLARVHGIDSPGLEGYLFPDTYEVEVGASERDIIRLMVKEFIRRVVPEYEASPMSTKVPLREVVILASLVEKEAKAEAERPVIAAIFYNRLRRGMALESCASVQYLLPRPKARLTLRDLKISSPYNTYLHTGLPPGPVANPGLASIRAALYPADVDYLFFVSNNDGTHTFSRTYASHIKAARRAKTK